MKNSKYFFKHYLITFIALKSAYQCWFRSLGERFKNNSTAISVDTTESGPSKVRHVMRGSHAESLASTDRDTRARGQIVFSCLRGGLSFKMADTETFESSLPRRCASASCRTCPKPRSSAPNSRASGRGGARLANPLVPHILICGVDRLKTSISD